MGWVRVPFAGLHLGDLLLHFQDIMLWLKVSLFVDELLMKLVSMM